MAAGGPLSRNVGRLTARAVAEASVAAGGLLSWHAGRLTAGAVAEAVVLGSGLQWPRVARCLGAQRERDAEGWCWERACMAAGGQLTEHAGREG